MIPVVNLLFHPWVSFVFFTLHPFFSLSFFSLLKGQSTFLMNIEKPEQISVLIFVDVSFEMPPSDRQQKTKCLSSETFIPPPRQSASLSPHLLIQNLSTQLRLLFQLQCFSLVTPVWAPYFCISSLSEVVPLFCQY